MSQKQSGLWADKLGIKLMELKTEYGIYAPIIKTLVDHGAVTLLERSLRKIMGEQKVNYHRLKTVA